MIIDINIFIMYIYYVYCFGIIGKNKCILGRSEILIWDGVRKLLCVDIKMLYLEVELEKKN